MRHFTLLLIALLPLPALAAEPLLPPQKTFQRVELAIYDDRVDSSTK